MNTAATVLIVAAICLVALVRADVVGPLPQERAPWSKPTKKYLATFQVHYPDHRLCPNCYLNFATSLNWTGYTPDSGLSNNFRAYRTAKDTYTATIPFTSDDSGSTQVATVYYSAWAADSSERLWLSTTCKNVLNNKSGSNKGRELTFVLPDKNVTYDVYPSFCYNEGKVQSLTLAAPQLDGVSKTVHYYIPGSLLENTIPRPVHYLLQGDAHAIQDSLKTTYDFVTSNGIIPETIVFGTGQGTIDDPWADGAALQRTYEMTPYACFVSEGGPPACAPRTGGAFASLDFLLKTALPAIRAKHSLPEVGRERMAVSGYSLGGLDACIYGYVNASVFSRAYCGSASMWYNNNAFAHTVKKSAPSHPVKFYLDVGGREHPFMNNFIPGAFKALLDRPEYTLGKNVMFTNYGDGPDSHQWNSWAAHTPMALSFLYNDAELLGTSLIPLANTFSYAEESRPFAIGAAFRVPVAKIQQTQGAIPATA